MQMDQNCENWWIMDSYIDCLQKTADLNMDLGAILGHKTLFQITVKFFMAKQTHMDLMHWDHP